MILLPLGQHDTGEVSHGPSERNLLGRLPAEPAPAAEPTPSWVVRPAQNRKQRLEPQRNVVRHLADAARRMLPWA
jgi:hypothetical protein